MGGRGTQRRAKNIPVEFDRRKSDRRVVDLEADGTSASYSGYHDLKTYANGNYRSFVATIDTEWNLFGVDVRLAEETLIEFYENGGVKSCVLAETSTLKVYGTPAPIQKLKPILFYETGNVKKFTLGLGKSGLFRSASDWSFRGERFKPGTTFEFSEDGKDIKK